MRNHVIIAAGGTGSRLGQAKGKQLLLIHGKPSVVWAIEAFQNCQQIHNIIVVIQNEDVATMKQLVNQFLLTKVSSIIVSSPVSRFYSVKQGVTAIQGAQKDDNVLIHDGARPLIQSNTISQLIQQNEPAIVMATPITDTIKQINNKNIIVATLDREQLFAVQTPQLFQYEILMKAYSTIRSDHFTDEAGLVEALGIPIKIFQGQSDNLKITTSIDLIIAEKKLMSCALA